MSENLSEEQVKEALESGYAQSEALLNDTDELDDFLYRLEQKINDMPFVGKKLCSREVYHSSLWDNISCFECTCLFPFSH